MNQRLGPPEPYDQLSTNSHIAVTDEGLQSVQHTVTPHVANTSHQRVCLSFKKAVSLLWVHNTTFTLCALAWFELTDIDLKQQRERG